MLNTINKNQNLSCKVKLSIVTNKELLEIMMV
jgi:hypothetical protein